MRIGGPIFENYNSPEEWINLLKLSRYTASCCPVEYTDSKETINIYKKYARKNNIIIAEVNAYSNPISNDEKERKEALEECCNQLALAEEIEANCCVSISGSKGDYWNQHCKENYSESTYNQIVDSVRYIIDTVNPKKTFYTLETLPWSYPDNPECYENLIKDIDRKQFGVHLDPANMITSPYLYYHSKELIKDCFKRFGNRIKSCHAKDVFMYETAPVHIENVCIGYGNLDFKTFISEIYKLNKDLPLILEHLNSEEEYISSRNYLFDLIKN